MAIEQFKVFKYMPYGPYETVMPYLVRRGQESRQVLREQEFQNGYLLNEVKSRFSPFKKWRINEYNISNTDDTQKKPLIGMYIPSFGVNQTLSI